MVCVGGAPQPTETNPDVIHVDEQYPTEEEPLPFDPKDVVNIRTNEKFEQFYDLDAEPIGEGKFGKVYRCVEKSTKLELAAKFIEIRKDADRKQVEHEISVMTRLQHPRIAQIYDAFYSANNDVILVMELVKGGELFNRVVEDNFVLTEAAAAVIICQLCEAIDYIHCQSIVHLDIKPENIMCVTESGNRIKLIDFGLARQYDGKEQLVYFAGTPEFSAPEVIKCDPLDFHTDMWSVGVITYILLSGYSPFLGETTPITWVNVERGEWDFIEEFDCVSEEAKDFISKLLIYDKSLRMLPKECLAHPWLASVRERAQKDALLDQPNVGPPISTANLKRYNIRRRFRKATYAVMSYCEFSQILGALRKRNSNGLAIIKKPRSITRKKKIPLVEAVLAAQNAEQNNSTPLEPMQLQEPVEPPKEERITLKTESSDSTKENKQIPTVVIGDSAENVAPVEAVVRKKKIVRKKKPIREQPARTTELDILRTQVDGSAPSESMLKKIKQTDETIAEVSPPERPKRRSVKKSVEEITEKVACEKPSTSENSILKTSLGKDLKNVEPKTDGKVPSPSSSSRSSFEAPKVRVNSLIAERLKNLQSDSVPLTFSISGKKFEPAKSLSATSEKSEAPKKGFKELSLVTEKKSTTTTTTQVKSKVENTERKFTTRTADKNIEETIEKRSTQQQVKVTQTTIAEEKCPETGVPRKTVQKNITKKQQQDKEVEKSRREEVLGMDKTTVKTMRSLHKELNDKATVEKKTKIDGETKDDKKMELQTIRLRKIDGRATQKVGEGRSSFQDMQVTVSSKTKSGIRCKDGSREEEENRQSQMEAKINVEKAKKSSTSEASSLLRELSRLKKTRPEEPELKSALRREGSTGEKKSVKLSEIILPRIRIDDDRGSAKVKFAESTHMAPLPSLPGVSGGGLQRNKSESNVAAKVKSSLSSTIKQKTVDDSGIRRKQHWLEADIEADLRPKEDFSFSSLKEKLERRVLGDPFIDARPPKETIKIPGASNAFAKWKKLEGAR